MCVQEKTARGRSGCQATPAVTAPVHVSAWWMAMVCGDSSHPPGTSCACLFVCNDVQHAELDIRSFEHLW